MRVLFLSLLAGAAPALVADDPCEENPGCKDPRCVIRGETCFPRATVPLRTAPGLTADELAALTRSAKRASRKKLEHEVVLLVHPDGRYVSSRVDGTHYYQANVEYLDEKDGLVARIGVPAEGDTSSGEGKAALEAWRGEARACERALRQHLQARGFVAAGRPPRELQLKAQLYTDPPEGEALPEEASQLDRLVRVEASLAGKQKVFFVDGLGLGGKGINVENCPAPTVLAAAPSGSRWLVLLQLSVPGGVDDANAAMGAMSGYGKCSPGTQVLELARDLSELRVGESSYKPLPPPE